MLSVMPMYLILFSASLCQLVHLFGLLSLSLPNAQGSIGPSIAAAPAVSADPPSPPPRSLLISVWYWLAAIVTAILGLTCLTLPLHVFMLSVDRHQRASFLSSVLEVTART